MTAREEIAELLIEQLETLDVLLRSDGWLCPCGPTYRVKGTAWAWSPLLRWHDPRADHATYWPAGS